MVRNVECTGIRIRQVLLDIEGRLGQRVLFSDEGDDSRLLMPAVLFFVVIGGWLLSR